jgi:hypothetical protein
MKTENYQKFEWTIKAFTALDTEGKGYLVKKDITQVLKD